MNPEVRNNNPNKSNETRWEQLEGLKQNPELMAERNGNSATEESLEDSPENREQTLAEQRELISQTYEKPKEAYCQMEYNKDENAIVPKERKKGDIFGKMKDKVKIKRMQLIFDRFFMKSIDAEVLPDPQKAFEKISPLLDEYTAQAAMQMCLDNITEDTTALASLILDKIDQETVGKALEPIVSFNYTGFVEQRGITEKTRKTAFIAVRDIAVNNPSETYFDDTTIASLSESEKNELAHIYFKQNHPERAVEFITRGNKDIFEADISEYFEKTENPSITGVFYCLGAGFSSESLHIDNELCETIIDAANDPSLEYGEIMIPWRLRMFEGTESAKEFGDELLKSVLTSHLNWWSNSPDYDQCSISVNEAKQLRALHEKMKASGTTLNPNFLVRFESNHSLISSLLTNDLNESRITALNRATKANIDNINSVEDLDNINQLLIERTEETLVDAQNAEKGSSEEFRANEKLVNQMSQLFFGSDYSDLIRSLFEISLVKGGSFLKGDDYLTHILDMDRKYQFSFDKFDEMVAAGSISKEAQAQAVICLSFLNCRRKPEKLREFFSEYKSLGLMGELGGFVDDMQEKLKAETNKNYANEMTTAEKAINSGCKVSTIAYEHENPDDGKKTDSLQVIKFDGQPFTILTHKLGAFGEFDYGHPENWNKKTDTNYISTSLITNDYIYTVGEKKRKKKAVFYGFGELQDDYIQGMAAVDLSTSSTARDEEADGAFINNSIGSKNTIHSNVETSRVVKWYTQVDELCKDTVRIGKDCTTHDIYNEVILRRYKKGAANINKENRVQPSCIIVFGVDESTITEDAKRHAAYFGVPIYLIDESKY